MGKILLKKGVRKKIIKELREQREKEEKEVLAKRSKEKKRKKGYWLRGQKRKRGERALLLKVKEMNNDKEFFSLLSPLLF